jgi:hypothetical protein
LQIIARGLLAIGDTSAASHIFPRIVRFGGKTSARHWLLSDISGMAIVRERAAC